MIYDRICNAKKYLGMSDELDLALNYIAEHLSNMPEAIELQGKNVRGFRSEYTTLTEDEAVFENHYDFVDIHIMTEGQERVAVSGMDSLSVYQSNVEEDYMLCRGDEETSLMMRPGSFLLVFPGEAHKVRVAIDTPQKVKKILFKIRVK